MTVPHPTTATAPSECPVPFVCPRCHGRLNREPHRYGCGGCRVAFPVVAGIPDFRLEPDPWIGIEDDRTKALRLAERIASLGFADAVRAYWEMTPGTPAARAQRFTDHVLGAADRSMEWLGIDHGRPPDGFPWIDLGCGTGDLCASGRGRGLRMVGIDVALRWLVVARRRPELAAGDGGGLVCCNAESLPFPDRSFGAALSIGLLEHCATPQRVLREARRVLVPGGVVRLRTVNRYSLLREPHVGVWGVGFVPRRWADGYVRWRVGAGYANHRPLSPRELRVAFRRSGFEAVAVRAARPLAAEWRRSGRLTRSLVSWYRWARRFPLVGRVVAWGAPLLEAGGTAP